MGPPSARTGQLSTHSKCSPASFLCSLGLGPSPSLAYPWTPFLGGLLLNCLVCRCLNLGGPFLGVTGPPITLVADRISALGGSRFMARMAETPRRPLASRLPHAVGWGHTRLVGGGDPSQPPCRSQPRRTEEILKHEILGMTPTTAPSHLQVGLQLGSGRGNESPGWLCRCTPLGWVGTLCLIPGGMPGS